MVWSRIWPKRVKMIVFHFRWTFNHRPIFIWCLCGIFLRTNKNFIAGGFSNIHFNKLLSVCLWITQAHGKQCQCQLLWLVVCGKWRTFAESVRCRTRGTRLYCHNSDFNALVNIMTSYFFKSLLLPPLVPAWFQVHGRWTKLDIMYNIVCTTYFIFVAQLDILSSE